MVFNDVVKSGMILPKKSRYTIREYRALRKKGYSSSLARFILVCSAVYHNTVWSHSLDNLEKLQIREYIGG